MVAAPTSRARVFLPIIGVLSIIGGLTIVSKAVRKFADEFLALFGPAPLRVIAAIAVGYGFVFIYAVT